MSIKNQEPIPIDIPDEFKKLLTYVFVRDCENIYTDIENVFELNVTCNSSCLVTA
jgi:hypothetical protein